MHFNPSKCNILQISNVKEPLLKFYQLEHRVLKHVDAAKYLGILIEKTLSFSDHILDITTKANRKLGFLKRNLRNTPPEVRKIAYVSLVRSSLEYGSTIWDPLGKERKKDIEKIQNRAIRWIFDKRPRERCSVTALRKQANLQTLELCREHQRLCLFYKMVHGDIIVTTEDVGLEPGDERTREGTKNPYKFRHKGGGATRQNICTISRTIPAWNRLPAEVVTAGSIVGF